MNDTVIRQVEQFVYREARLLGERRFASGSSCLPKISAIGWGRELRATRK